MTGYKYGERHHRAKLTDHDVDLIRILRREGLSYTVIAAKFEVNFSTVRDIVKGRTRAYSGAEA